METFSNERPALGDLKEGDEVIVIPRPYRSVSEPIRARVARVARVFVFLQADRRTWRMRMDTQNEGSKQYTTDRFVTEEQYAWDRKLNDAVKFLRDNGISLRSDAPFNQPAMLVRLAEMVKESLS